LPGKHSTAFPLRRYGFIAGATTLLVVLVSWVAVRAVGPSAADARVPLMVQPTVPLAAGAVPSLPPSGPASTTPSAGPSTSPSASRSPSPSPKVSTTPTAISTTLKPTRKATTKPTTPRTTAAATPAFTGSYTAGGGWDRGFIGAVTVTNKTGPARGWTVRITYDSRHGVRVGNVWNARLDRQGNTFVFTGGPVGPGASATFGFEASKQVRGSIQPTACTVDGASCRLS
jgi:hypothetical protein